MAELADDSRVNVAAGFCIVPPGMGGCGAFRCTSSAVFDDCPQCGHRSIHPGCAQPMCGQCGHPNRVGVGVGVVALAIVSGGEQSYPRCDLRGNIDYVHTIIAQAMRQRRSQAAGTLFLRSGCSTILGESVQLSATSSLIGTGRWLTIAAKRRPLLQSTTLCEDQRRLSPDFRMLEYSHHHSPQDWNPFDSGGHTNFRLCRPLLSHSCRSAPTRTASRLAPRLALLTQAISLWIVIRHLRAAPGGKCDGDGCDRNRGRLGLLCAEE